MSSYINSYYNSVTRMSGLSGLDVDGIVATLMLIEKAKVNRVVQQRQLLLWKQEQYREITSALQSLANEYFNTLKPATDLRNPSVYNAFSTKYNGSDTCSYFTVTAGSGARAGNYTISKIVTATVARVVSSAVAGDIVGSTLEPGKINGISASQNNNRVAVTFNGVTKEIIIKDNPADINDLASDLQSKLDYAFGSGKITVEANNGRLTFKTDNTNTLSFSGVVNGGYSAIFESDLSNGVTLTYQNNRFKIILGSEEREIILEPGTYADADSLATVIQTLVDDENIGFGRKEEDGNRKIEVKVENNRIVLVSTDPQMSVSASSIENTGLKAIGLADSNKSNKIDLTANIDDIRNNFAVPLSNDTEISFVINGQTFTFDAKTTSLNDIMTAVNANSEANVKMSYDALNNKFILETKQTGVTARISAYDLSGGFLESLSLVVEDIKGRDASIVFDDGINGKQTITRSTNTFTINGLTFNLIKDYSGEIDVSVNPDPTKAVELIKGFVEKYNEVLDKINAKLSEVRDYDYEPLTDDQKEALTEDEIKKWEEKAKTGLLSGDSLLRSIVSGLRNAILEPVDGISLASIGIKSSSWADKGKLYIDEEKLKKALMENPEQVINLFTKQSDRSYTEAVSNPSARKERFEESGIIYRLYDVIQDNIRTTTINGKRGALLEKAGMAGDRSAYNNTLYNQILEYTLKIEELNDELTSKENFYYSMFAKLETLINQMNTQSVWLAQQFLR